MPPLEIHTRDAGSRARTGTLHLAHGEVRTPAFVPLATKAVVKTLEAAEVPRSASTWCSATPST